MLDMLPVGACVISEELIVSDWNEKLVEWTGISKDQVIGSDLSTKFPNIREPRYYQRLQQVFATGMPVKYSAALHKHFLPVPVRHGLNDLAGEYMVQETEVRLCSRAPKLAMCTIQDFSFQFGQLGQLKQERAGLMKMKEQLERTNKRLQNRNEELDEFCHVASHDLQQPLERLINLCKLLENGSGKSLDNEGTRCLEGMLESSRHMRAIIIDLLALSRSGRSEPNIQVVSAEESANIAMELLEEKIRETRASIEFDTLPDVLGDVVLLAQIYQNLISNSLQFHGRMEAPRIQLTAEREGDYWRLGVKDDGIGLSQEEALRVFQPFQSFGQRGEASVGSGVGLTLCKNAVNRMGGEIAITSNQNEGCQVTFTVPAPTDHDLASEGAL